MPKKKQKKGAKIRGTHNNPDLMPEDIGEEIVGPSYEQVAAALDTVLIPATNSRQNVKRAASQVVNGMCLGIVNARSKGIVYSLAARLRPNLTKTLVNFARKNCPKFKFTSIQVNKNYLSALHVDGNNLGPSKIVGVGRYKDGGLWTMKGALDCKHKWESFDGNMPHATLPYKGTRYTLIFFSHQSHAK